MTQFRTSCLPSAIRRSLSASSTASMLPLVVALSGSALVSGTAHAAADHAAVDYASPFTLRAAVNGPDSDGDGIRNQDDKDDDNDGIPDVLEGLVENDGDGFPDNNSVDTDGDGTPDGLDLDSDNDGILDNLEARLDRGLVNELDQVPNGAIDIRFSVGLNGLADVIETSPDSGVTKYPLPDTDNDGVPDFRDSDSDGDGIYDVVEAGGVDNDTDGRLDGFYDADGKGVDDVIQAGALPIFDTDGDRIPDFRDLDSDGDGLTDAQERGASGSFPRDTDGDGAPDYRELDSNGDGKPDSASTGNTAAVGNTAGSGNTDSNGNSAAGKPPANSGNPGQTTTSKPTLQAHPDRDADGIVNQQDLDDDNDGILDTEEEGVDADGNGVADAGKSRDRDGDGTPDINDLDSDNDGIPDVVEGRLDAATIVALNATRVGAIDIAKPVGANGLADAIETGVDSGQPSTPLFDTDGDGTPDYLDLDSDNDGISDLVEAGGFDLDNDGQIDSFVDADDKGVDDAVQASALPLFDTDGDGVYDFRDTDSDGDGLSDAVEGAGSGSAPTDSDNDGAADYREQDADNDGVKDSVEAGSDPAFPQDSNGDGTPDFQDASVQGGAMTAQSGSTPGGSNGKPTAPAPGGSSNDLDGDGVIDILDVDDDNDGLFDVVEGNGDADSDGVPNKRDLDSDNDGIPDAMESGLSLARLMLYDKNRNGQFDELAAGKNGFADKLESTPESSASTFSVADTDGDSIADFLDLDSDNDSVFDSLEANHLNISLGGRLSEAAMIGKTGMAEEYSRVAIDTDGDGVPDFRDLDSDNDSIVDLVEARGRDADNDGRIDRLVDRNSDGSDDGIQRTTTAWVDTDGDRVPDMRDLDSDQDSLSDLIETHGVNVDQNNDGVIDNFVDTNADGRDDTYAALSSGVIDTDCDGLPDHIDADSDGDGISDLIEGGGVDNDSDHRADRLADRDGDGVPDLVDADLTGGVDSNGNGIDDAFDAAFTGGKDTDNDGIDDLFDPNSDGNGFVGPANDGSNLAGGQGTPVILPDEDGNGVPDFQQGVSKVETGGGSGCSIVVRAGGQGGVDPLFGLLLASGAVSLLGARRRRQLTRAAVIGGASLSMAACSMLDFGGRLGDFGSRDPNFNSRVYVGAGGLISNLEPDASDDANFKVDETQSAGGSLAIGYDISNRFAIEGHIAELGEATLDPDATIGYQVGGISGLVYGLNDTRDRSRREGFSVFGRLGLGGMKNQADGVTFKRVNDFHLLAGVGVEYGLENGLGLRAELVGHETDAKYAQLGLVYRFGDAGSRSGARAPKRDKEKDGASVKAVPAASAPLGSPTDLDRDGVPDNRDACTDTLDGRPVNDQGCDVFAGVIEGVEFESGSDTLTAEAKPTLDSVAETLREYPDVTVSVEAHTDNQGSAAGNEQLSSRRAVAVARYLVQQGVAAGRLKPKAYGESRPRASNATAEGRAMNRRVEFEIVE